MMGLWTHAEVAVGIICSCLPVLPIFFQTIWPKIVSCINTSLLILNGFKNLKPRRSGSKRIDDPRNSSSNSVGTLHRTYELQGRNELSGETEVLPIERGTGTISEATAQTIQPLTPSSGDAATDSRPLENRQNNNQILKTVTIETVRDAWDSEGSDMERQRRAPW